MGPESLTKSGRQKERRGVMSVNLYLKGDEVRKIEGFETRKRRERERDRDREWNEYYLPGVSLYHEKGRWFTTLSELTEPIPAVVGDLVEESHFRILSRITPKGKPASTATSRRKQRLSCMVARRHKSRFVGKIWRIFLLFIAG
jgi:hypothetical protein